MFYGCINCPTDASLFNSIQHSLIVYLLGSGAIPEHIPIRPQQCFLIYYTVTASCKKRLIVYITFCGQYIGPSPNS